jgi:hypothetical protein
MAIISALMHSTVHATAACPHQPSTHVLLAKIRSRQHTDVWPLATTEIGPVVSCCLSLTVCHSVPAICRPLASSTAESANWSGATGTSDALSNYCAICLLKCVQRQSASPLTVVPGLGGAMASSGQATAFAGRKRIVAHCFIGLARGATDF